MFGVGISFLLCIFYHCLFLPSNDLILDPSVLFTSDSSDSSPAKVKKIEEADSLLGFYPVIKWKHRNNIRMHRMSFDPLAQIRRGT